jgi:hypothetical protein
MSNENINESLQKERKKFTAKYITSSPEKLYLSEIKDEEGQKVSDGYFLNIKEIYKDLESFLQGLVMGDEIEFESVGEEKKYPYFNGYKLESPDHIRKKND